MNFNVCVCARGGERSNRREDDGGQVGGRGGARRGGGRVPSLEFQRNLDTPCDIVCPPVERRTARERMTPLLSEFTFRSD